MGYTNLESYIYNDPNDAVGSVASVMFSGQGDSSPTPVFGYVAEATGRAATSAPYAAVSEFGRPHDPGNAKSVPSTGLTQWNVGGSSSSKWNNKGGVSTGGYTDYITAIMPITGSEGAPDSSYPDTLVGYFTPLLASNPGCTFVGGLEFMIVNGTTGTPTAYNAPGAPLRRRAVVSAQFQLQYLGL